jgi:hypothetical protein
MMRRLAIPALVAGVMVLAASAHAVDIDLIAKEFTKTLPDSSTVKMWGFAPGNNACWTAPDPLLSTDCTTPVATSPGPRLTILPTDTAVNIRVVNMLLLADGGENISLVIPGQAMPYHAGGNGPTWTDGSTGSTGTPGTRRVRSFGLETPVDGGKREYLWDTAQSNALRPGTYLYHSGSHPQLQVQMGLYGAITRDSATGTAYAGIPYDNETLILYSEIDTALHDEVTSGTYTTSTFDYQPQYYLVNGEPFTSTTPAITGPMIGERTLLRLLNAGLQTHTASLQNMRMSIVAEDGNPYPAARDEQSALLAPLKTRDAILTPSAAGTRALYDGMLNLSNTDGSAGGMLAFLEVGGTPPANTAPVAADDPGYAVNQNATLTIAAPGVLGNDSDPDAHAISAVLDAYLGTGSLALSSDGSFVYTPALNFTGADTFTYKASDGDMDSLVATATITVVAVANNPPVANDQSLTTGQLLVGGNSEAVPIVLTGSDPDGNFVFFTVTGGPTSGSLTGTSPNLTYTPNLGFSGTDSFTYKATDVPSIADSLVDAVVDITVVENQAPSAEVDTITTPENQVVVFSLTANDADPDIHGSIDVTSVVITKAPKHADSLIVNGDGTVTYDPRDDYAGSDSFRYRVADDDGELSTNPNGRDDTKVRINLVPIP